MNRGRARLGLVGGVPIASTKHEEEGRKQKKKTLTPDHRSKSAYTQGSGAEPISQDAPARECNEGDVARARCRNSRGKGGVGEGVQLIPSSG